MYNNDLSDNNVSFKFGFDGTNYGYYKVGADTVTPFNSGLIKGVIGMFEPNNTNATTLLIIGENGETFLARTNRNNAINYINNNCEFCTASVKSGTDYGISLTITKSGEYYWKTATASMSYTFEEGDIFPETLWTASHLQCLIFKG